MRFIYFATLAAGLVSSSTLFDRNYGYCKKDDCLKEVQYNHNGKKDCSSFFQTTIIKTKPAHTRTTTKTRTRYIRGSTQITTTGLATATSESVIDVTTTDTSTTEDLTTTTDTATSTTSTTATLSQTTTFTGDPTIVSLLPTEPANPTAKKVKRNAPKRPHYASCCSRYASQYSSACDCVGVHPAQTTTTTTKGTTTITVTTTTTLSVTVSKTKGITITSTDLLTSTSTTTSTTLTTDSSTITSDVTVATTDVSTTTATATTTTHPAGAQVTCDFFYLYRLDSSSGNPLYINDLANGYFDGEGYPASSPDTGRSVYQLSLSSGLQIVSGAMPDNRAFILATNPGSSAILSRYTETNAYVEPHCAFDQSSTKLLCTAADGSAAMFYSYSPSGQNRVLYFDYPGSASALGPYDIYGECAPLR